MNIELVRVKKEEIYVLQNLTEFYSYDFCRFFDYDLN